LIHDTLNSLSHLLRVGDGAEDLTLPFLQGDGEVSRLAAFQTFLSGGRLSFAMAEVVQVCTKRQSSMGPNYSTVG
jgi:hypothetical protein